VICRAIHSARKRFIPEQIVLAVPVAPKDALDELQTEVDEIICLSTPSPFCAPSGSRLTAKSRPMASGLKTAAASEASAFS
jgi:hypothetical protein